MLGLALALPAPAAAWGFYPHQLIAAMAYAEARPATRRAVRDLLRHADKIGTPECPITRVEDLGTWADCARNLPAFKHTDTWHYQNISVCRDFDASAKCSGGYCVTAIIPVQAAALADRSKPPAERLVALAFLVHFVADLHQPLHAGDKDDRGGNDVSAAYGAKDLPRMNLHRIWDTEITERAVTEPPALRARPLAPGERRRWQTGGPVDWARESWQAARDLGYANLRDYPDQCATPGVSRPAEGAAPRTVIDQTYVQAAIPVVREQVSAAAARTAMLLDRALAR